MSSSVANIFVLLSLGMSGILLMTRKLKRVVKQDLEAFVTRFEILPPPPPAPPKAPHPLAGLTFAVADVFHIDGHVTGFGNPEWARTHEPASRTSPVVSALIEGGATCVGKTVIDDMASRYVSASVVKINILGHQQILQLLIGYLEDAQADQL